MRNSQVAGLFVVAAFLSAACAGSAPEAAPQTVTLQAVDLDFTPETLEVKAGERVELVLQNDGVLEHDFSVMEIPTEGTVEASGDSGHAAGHDDGDEPDLHVSALGGQSATLSFTPSQPGTYEFWCTVAGHKEGGMTGTLVVQAP
jgi:uncharacterized cupredoxin-like copper-binding protein